MKSISTPEIPNTFSILGRIFSKKNSRRNFRLRNGRTVSLPSVGFERFRVQALDQLEKQGCLPIKSPYEVHYLFSIKGKSRIDIDNMIASINDILQDCKVIDDDTNVLKVNAEKMLEAKDFSCQIRVTTLTQPPRLH